MNSTTQPAVSPLRSIPSADAFWKTGTLLALGPIAAHAATEPQKDEKKTAGSPQALPEMVVKAGAEKKEYKVENLQSPKITQPLRDVAKTVTVVPEEVIREQGATSLRDVLRNVPGISMQAGEGGGGPSGDNLAIRGFAARSDIFIDGMRDTAGGGYARDPFNIEQVEVTKGPASANSGRGSTGGSVNIATKQARLGNSYGGSLTGGTDNLYRGTLDVNQEISGLAGSAVRLNAMLHTQDVAGRDGVEQERWGVAPSATFGLGTDTEVTFSYMRLSLDNTPDYGLPWVGHRTVQNTDGTTTTNIYPFANSGKPPVSLSNWYGIPGRDYEHIDADIASAGVSHKFNEDFSLQSMFRYSRIRRDSVTTAPRFASLSSTEDAAGNVTNNYGSVLNQQFQSRYQTDESFANQTNFRYDFATGPVEHNLVTGFELSHEDSRNHSREMFDPTTGDAVTSTSDPRYPKIDLLTGLPVVPYNLAIRRSGAYTDASVDSAALYLFDTAKINKQWEITGGVRYDTTSTDYVAFDPSADGTPDDPIRFARTVADDVFSYRAGVTFKPVEQGSIYLGYGTSYNPSTEFLTYGTNSDNIDVDPEESETIELGTKWEFFDEKLLLTGAVFQTTKSNARTTDPVTDIVSLTGEQEVRGFEVGFTGSLTEDWRLLGGYTYLDSEVTESANPFERGSEISNTPENSASLWTVHDLPAGFNVGLGAQYVGARFNNNNSETRQRAQGFTLFNAMAGYQLNDNIGFRLNVDNLLDKEYIDRVGGGHFIPGQGRTISLTADFKF